MTISLRDRVRKRREDEDDDMMLFLFPALYLMGSTRGGGEKKNVIHQKRQARLRFVDSSRDMSRTAKLHLGWNPTSSERWRLILEGEGLSLIQGSR
jgi:hypothetical protein